MEDIRRQLQCRSCKGPMFPPILVCKSMESVCQECRQKYDKCPLCSKKFTDQRNEALEVLTKIACFNCNRCGAPLMLVELRQHYDSCVQKEQTSTGNIKCPIEKCPWQGNRTQIVDHWRSKKLSLRPFNDDLISKTKLTKFSYFANLVEAYESTFFFKSLCTDSDIFWALQYVGDPQQAGKFSYEIEIFHSNQLGRKCILSSYCQSIELANSNLLKEGACIYMPKELLRSYSTDDWILYNLQVKLVDPSYEEKNRKRVEKLLEKYLKKQSDV